MYLNILLVKTTCLSSQDLIPTDLKVYWKINIQKSPKLIFRNIPS